MSVRNLDAKGFIWFVGFVTNLEDEDKLGQVQIRIPVTHDDLNDDELPYAMMINPIQSSSLNGVGISPTGIEVGSMVVGFFADGIEKNVPMILGTIPKIPENDPEKHDVNRLAREENIIQKTPVPATTPFKGEPETAYKAKYPHNKTVTTKSGHAVEIDDTPGQERIHIYHKSGTYSEINNKGRKVQKTVDDDFEVIIKDKEVYIGGKVNVFVKGDATLKIDGNYKMDIGGTCDITSVKDMTLVANNIHLNP